MSYEFGDPISDGAKEACAVSVMRAMLEDYCTKTGVEFDSALNGFSSSQTYGLLFDFETRLWAEGPDYLRNMWEKEVKKTLCDRGL